MSITFNARWTNGQPDWLKEPGRSFQRAAAFATKVGAQEYTESVLDYIRLGRSFTSRTGQLEQSITWRATNDGDAVVSANAEHAPHIEYGTAPHVIKPKAGRKFLRFPGAGGFVFAKQVNHPGTTAQPFFFADGQRREGVVLKAMGEAFADKMSGRT